MKGLSYSEIERKIHRITKEEFDTAVITTEPMYRREITIDGILYVYEV